MTVIWNGAIDGPCRGILCIQNLPLPREAPELKSTDAADVLACLMSGPAEGMTSRAIARELGWTSSRPNPPLYWLMRTGKVVKGGYGDEVGRRKPVRRYRVMV